MFDQPLDRVGLEQVSTEFEGAGQRSARLLKAQDQVVSRDHEFLIDHRQGDTRHLQLGRRFVQQLKGNLENGSIALVTLGLEFVNQLLKGHILVGKRFQASAAHAGEQLRDRGGAGQIGAESNRVEKKPDQLFDFGALAVRGDRPHDNIVLAAVTRQEQRIAGEQRHKQGNTHIVAECI